MDATGAKGRCRVRKRPIRTKLQQGSQPTPLRSAAANDPTVESQDREACKNQSSVCQQGSSCWFASVQVLLSSLRPYLEPLGVSTEILDYAGKVYLCRYNTDAVSFKELCDVPPVWLRKRYDYLMSTARVADPATQPLGLIDSLRKNDGGWNNQLLMAALYSARNGLAYASWFHDAKSYPKKGLAEAVDAFLYRKAPLPEDTDIGLFVIKGLDVPFPGLGYEDAEWIENTLWGAEHVVGGIFTVEEHGEEDLHAVAFTLCRTSKQLMICNTYGGGCIAVQNNNVPYLELPHAEEKRIYEAQKLWEKWTVTEMAVVATRSRARDTHAPTFEYPKNYRSSFDSAFDAHFVARYGMKTAAKRNLPIYWALRGKPEYEHLLKVKKTEIKN